MNSEARSIFDIEGFARPITEMIPSTTLTGCYDSFSVIYETDFDPKNELIEKWDWSNKESDERDESAPTFEWVDLGKMQVNSTTTKWSNVSKIVDRFGNDGFQSATVYESPQGYITLINHCISFD